MFPLSAKFANQSNKQRSQALHTQFSTRYKFLAALFETKWGFFFFLLFTCGNYFPIKCSDKIHLQALNAVDFPFHHVAHCMPLSLRVEKKKKKRFNKLPWQNMVGGKKSERTMGKRQFSTRDKQISVLNWKPGVRLVCLPKKMDPHAELQLNHI